MRLRPTQLDPRLTRVFLSQHLALGVQLWLLAVFVLCVLPLSGLPAPWSFSDKIVHALMYAVPTFALTCFARMTRYWLLYLLAFGIGIELVQSLLPYRSGDVWDAVANSCGVLLGWLAARGCVWLWRRWR